MSPKMKFFQGRFFQPVPSIDIPLGETLEFTLFKGPQMLVAKYDGIAVENQ